MCKTIITIAWTDEAMRSLFASIPDAERITTFKGTVESGNLHADMIPQWVNAGWIKTYRAETLLP